MNNIEKLLKFIRFHIQNSKFGVVLSNPKDIHEPITKAVDNLSKTLQGKRNDIVNPEAISDPIVEAQKATTEAVKGIKIPEPMPTDFTSLEAKLEALLTALENKEMVVNIGKTEIDLKSVINAIEKIKLEVPKMEKQEVIDYTMMFSGMMDIMEKPFDQTEIKKLQGLVSKIGTSMDLAVIAEWLKVIAEKPISEFPELSFNKSGRLKVEVDKVGGGGGGGLTTIQENYLKDISEKWGYCADSLTATYQYYFFEDKDSNYKIMRETLATGVYAYATGTGGYTSVYVDNTSDPAGSPTFGTYGEIF
jgi:hypothetical protein